MIKSKILNYLKTKDVILTEKHTDTTLCATLRDTKANLY